MVLKFRIGQTDWKLIEGFKEVHYFNVKRCLSNKDGNEIPQEFYCPWGSEDKFNPSVIFYINLKEMGPVRDIGIIGRMKDENDLNSFLLLGADEVFILNDEGKTIDRCY